jgi:hypothetical protein
VAIYYGATTLSYARWTKHNDFREGCISDIDHDLPMSAECSEELLRSRVSMMIKRQIVGAHSALLGEHSIRFAGLKFAASFVLGIAVCIGFDWLSKRDWKDFRFRVEEYLHVFLSWSFYGLVAVVVTVLGAIAIIPVIIFAVLWLLLYVLWHILRGESLP